MVSRLMQRCTIASTAAGNKTGNSRMVLLQTFVQWQLARAGRHLLQLSCCCNVRTGKPVTVMV
jgi:hypothetical protein